MTFPPKIAQLLPDAQTLFLSAKPAGHPNVERIVLHSSQRLAGSAHLDTDIDQSQIMDIPAGLKAAEFKSSLRIVYNPTLNVWQADVEPDLAVISEMRCSALHCFTQTQWGVEWFCPICGLGCFGHHKVQKGFYGLVTNSGVHVIKMNPCDEIWR